MQIQTPQLYYTPEEYLQLEETAEFKNEYRDGEIIAINSSTTNHNEIAGNFSANFKFTMRGKNYKIYMGDVKLWIPRHRIYTYPDVMVIEGEPIYEGSGTTTVNTVRLRIFVGWVERSETQQTRANVGFRSSTQPTHFYFLALTEPYCDYSDKSLNNC